MTEYYRLSGGGNDFLVLVEPKLLPSESEIAAWCRRGISVGADGVFLLDRRGAGVRTRHFNADGRAAELCLNGTRCAVRLALELGWVSGGEEAFPIETGAGTFRACVVGPDRVQIDLPVPDEAPRRCSLHVGDRTHLGWAICIGVPHFVLQVERGLAELELSAVGPALRYHEHFSPHGVNIDWIELQRDGFAIRTWERGVEGETLACGTGVLAATAAAVAAGTLDLPVDVQTLGGFVFSVRGATADGALKAWSLIGDARLIARGEIYPGAVAQP